MRRQFLYSVLLISLLIYFVSLAYPPFSWLLVIFLPAFLLGFYDYFQPNHSLRRNYPFVGRFRYVLETIRPEIYQYFVESDTDGVPFSRDKRSLVYQRAKGARDTVPFGTLRDVYEVGYEWVNHSLQPLHLETKDLRVLVGGPDCTQPYSASILNISAMSYGSLSKNAILALSMGAKLGGFAHNTGEGGISPYHLQGGADLIWQIGTGYFGCRREDGRFNLDTFAQQAVHPNVKMIEIKLSQGAKPGHGGILPAAKVTAEIAKIRHVPMGKDVISPPAHSSFSTPIGLLEFVAELRHLSGGKPVGFKLCIGKRREFLAICKAMLATGITPDFITIDGGEGGTGAAPLEFSDHVGVPLMEGLIYAHNALVGVGLRSQIRVIASGKVISGFDMVKRLALGADMCNSARAMMLALGCIQALKCNTNHCPVGVATQDSNMVAGLVPKKKRVRIASYHKETIESLSEILGATGLSTPTELKPHHILRRVSLTEIRNYEQIYGYVQEGDLLKEEIKTPFAEAWRAAAADTFAHVH